MMDIRGLILFPGIILKKINIYYTAYPGKISQKWIQDFKILLVHLRFLIWNGLTV